MLKAQYPQDYEILEALASQYFRGTYLIRGKTHPEIYFDKIPQMAKWLEDILEDINKTDEESLKHARAIVLTLLSVGLGVKRRQGSFEPEKLETSDASLDSEPK